MLNPLSNAQASPQWLQDYWTDFQRRFRALLPLAFKVKRQHGVQSLSVLGSCCMLVLTLLCSSTFLPLWAWV